MQQIVKQRAVSKSSPSVDQRISHSLSPPNQHQHNRSSLHSGSSNKRPNITFTYQGQFHHEFPQNAHEHQHLVHQNQVKPIAQSTQVIEKHTVIWEHRFTTIYRHFSFFSQQFQHFSHEFTILTKQFEKAQTQEEIQMLKIRYTELL